MRLPRGDILTNVERLGLLGADLQANEDMSVIHYPVSEWADQLYHMETM